MNIGFFFDGTDNNKNYHKSEGLDSNIARLFDAYYENRELGFFKYYVSGVGTPFYEIGRLEAETGGGPFGVAGDDRIIYGLLELINSIYVSFGLAEKFQEKEYQALLDGFFIREGYNSYPLDGNSPEYVLKKYELEYGLNQYKLKGTSHNPPFPAMCQGSAPQFVKNSAI